MHKTVVVTRTEWVNQYLANHACICEEFCFGLLLNVFQCDLDLFYFNGSYFRVSGWAFEGFTVQLDRGNIRIPLS